MPKSVISHLKNSAKKLNCDFNTQLPEFDQTVLYMVANQTEKGNTRCPCDATGKTMCPCKEWVQRVKTGTAKPGDKCHCEILVKLKNIAEDGQFVDPVKICRIPGRMICTSGYEGRCSKCNIADKHLNPD